MREMSTVFYCTFQNIKIVWFDPLSMERAKDMILQSKLIEKGHLIQIQIFILLQIVGLNFVSLSYIYQNQKNY